MKNVKLDPLAYVLILIVLGIQVYGTFVGGSEVQRVLDENDAAYQAAVFNEVENKGVMHQIFRQNEVDRDLLKTLLVRCGR